MYFHSTTSSIILIMQSLKSYFYFQPEIQRFLNKGGEIKDRRVTMHFEITIKLISMVSFGNGFIFPRFRVYVYLC